MDSLDLIRTFREVALQGNFSRAAKKLAMSKATVSKYVAELEARFGVRLLNRSTRSVSLTDAGVLLLERSTPMLEMIELTQVELQERARQPSGRLRISAPHGMGQGNFPNLLADFMGHYPKVSISLHLSNHPIDLAGEGIDVALVLCPLANDNLIVRCLQQVDYMVCASPRYWQKHGKPSHPSELSAHDALTHAVLGDNPLWRFEANGKPFDVPARSRMDATESGPLIQIATQGYGVIYVPQVTVQPHVDSGALEAVLQPYVRKDIWLCAAYLQRRHNSAALRVLLDFLETKMGSQARTGRP